MKKLSTKQTVINSYIIIGCLWILNGITKIFDGLIPDIICIILMVGIIIALIFNMRGKKEEVEINDKLASKVNIISILTRVSCLLFVVCLILKTFTNIDEIFILGSLLSIIIGMMNIIMGVVFIKFLKKEG